MSYGKFAPKLPINNTYNPRMSEAWNTGAALGNLLGTLWGVNYQKRGDKKTYDEAQDILNNMGKREPASDSLYQDYSNLNISAAEPQASTKPTDKSKSTVKDVPTLNVGDVRALEKANFTKNYIEKYKSDPNAVGNTIASTGIAETVNRNLKNLNTAQAPTSFKAADMRAAIEAELMRRNKPASQIENAMKLIEPQLLAKEEEYNKNKSDELYQQYVASKGSDLSALASLAKVNPALADFAYKDYAYNRARTDKLNDEERNEQRLIKREQRAYDAKTAYADYIQNQKRSTLYQGLRARYPDATDAEIDQAVNMYMAGLVDKNAGSGSSSGDGTGAKQRFTGYASEDYKHREKQLKALQDKENNGETLSKEELQQKAQLDYSLKQDDAARFGGSGTNGENIAKLQEVIQREISNGKSFSKIKRDIISAYPAGDPRRKLIESDLESAVASMDLDNSQSIAPQSNTFKAGPTSNSDSAKPEATPTGNAKEPTGVFGNMGDFRVADAAVSAKQPPAGVIGNAGEFRVADAAIPVEQQASAGVIGNMGEFRMADAAIPVEAQSYTPAPEYGGSGGSYASKYGDIPADLQSRLQALMEAQRAKKQSEPVPEYGGGGGSYATSGYGSVPADLQTRLQAVMDAQKGNRSMALPTELGNNPYGGSGGPYATRYGDVPADLQAKLQNIMETQRGNRNMQLPTSFGSGPSYLADKAAAQEMMPTISPKAVQEVMDAENPNVQLYSKKPTSGSSTGITMFYADEASRNPNFGHAEGKEGIHYGASTLVNRFRDLWGLVPYRESDGTNCARTASVALNGTPYSGMFNVDQFIATAKKLGQLRSAGSGYVPQAGDLAVTNNGNHIVMVTENGGTIQNGRSGNGGKGGVYEEANPPALQRGGVQYYISTSQYERFFPNFYFDTGLERDIAGIGKILANMRR